MLFNFHVVISVNSCLNFRPININIAFVYITITDYGALKSRDLRLLWKHVSKTCLRRVNLKQITLLKVYISILTRTLQYNYIELRMFLI